MERKIMRCPICNCKMKHKTICPYCKITGEQVSGASNQLAKVALRSGEKQKVVYSSTFPYDVNYTRLLLLTIFTGFLGVHNFYIGRDKKGVFCIASLVLTIIFMILDMAFNATRFFVYDLFYEIFFLCATITIMFWIYDILCLAFKSFKMPVVLLDNERAKVNNDMKRTSKKKGEK